MRLKYFNRLNILVILLVTSICYTFPVFPQKGDPSIAKSEVLYTQGKYEEAIRVLSDRLKIAVKNNESATRVLIYNSIGRANSQLGKPIEALKYYQLAATLADEANDRNTLGKIEKNIGALYEEQNNFDQALAHYKEAETIAKEIKNEFLLADIYNNMGIVHEQQTNYPLALKMYGRALESYRKLKQKDRIALTLNNMGIVYKFLGDYSKAIDFYQKSLQHSESLGDRFMVAANFNNIGNVYGKLYDYPRAIQYNLKSLTLAEEIGASNIIVEALSSLAEHHAGSGNYKKAYEWNQKFIKANADYINLESAKKLAELQSLYQSEKQKRQIGNLKQGTQISDLKLRAQELLIQKRNYQILFGLLLLIIGLAVLYYLYRRKQHKLRKAHLKAIQEIQNEERIRIAQDVHDDIGSGLSKISLIAASASKKFKANDLESTEFAHITQVSKNLVENIRDLIWVLNPENATLDNLIARIREYCSDYLEACAVSAELNIQDEVPRLKISQQVQRNIFLTVKEALHNCAKHAKCDSIIINLSYMDKELVINITDNGIGFDENNLKGKGNGLRNMRKRITSIGGKLKSISNQNVGTIIRINIKQRRLQHAAVSTTKM